MTTTAGRTYRPPFDPRATYVAARDLRWGMPDGEIAIPSGAPFDRARLDCDDWTARRLYRTRHIAMVLADGEQVAPDSQASQVTTPSPAPPTSPKPQPAPPADPPPPPPAARKLEAKSRGFGRFVVVDERGNRVHPPEGRWLTRAEAEAFAKA